MRRIISSLVAVGAVTVAACNIDLTNPNNPTPGGAAENPRASTGRMIAGVMSTYRASKAGQIQDFGSYGREIYNMFITDGRQITGPYRDWRQNNAFTAGTQWAGRYGNYRNAYEALKIVNNTPTTTTAGLPTAFLAEEKAGANGFLKTYIALDLLHAIEARGPIGIVVDITDDVNAVLPIVSQDSALSWISAKLDEANADLSAAGATFYFRIYTGFGSGVTGPTTPAGVSQFNRAIKARVEAYRGSLGCGPTCYTAALTALAGTWIADLTALNRDNGYYLVYSTAAGDALNVVSFAVNSDYYLHPGIDSIPGVALDDRYRRKVALAATSPCTATYGSRSEVSVSATHRPCAYATNTTPIPIIRNEELVLLRAEAEWFTGATAAAITDLAAVRANSGASGAGTTSVVAFAAPATDSQFVSELLLQRTLSLFFEGHRFPDYRRFNRLAELGTLAQDVAQNFSVATASVLPSQECDARSRVGAPAPMSCPGGPVVP